MEIDNNKNHAVFFFLFFFNVTANYVTSTLSMEFSIILKANKMIAVTMALLT